MGTRSKACILSSFGLTFSNAGMTKAAVLPVPFLARARMSRPVKAIGIDSSWMERGVRIRLRRFPLGVRVSNKCFPIQVLL